MGHFAFVAGVNSSLTFGKQTNHNTLKMPYPPMPHGGVAYGDVCLIKGSVLVEVASIVL
jgi:hypothetical protein